MQKLAEPGLVSQVTDTSVRSGVDHGTADLRLHSSAAARLLYSGAGIVATSLGVLGVFLPLLPTTPFILLAAFCFSRSSPKFHAALLSNRYLGPPLLQWRQKRCIDKTMRQRAMMITLAMFAISIVIVGRWDLRLMLAAMCVILIGGLRLLPTCDAGCGDS